MQIKRIAEIIIYLLKDLLFNLSKVIIYLGTSIASANLIKKPDKFNRILRIFALLVMERSHGKKYLDSLNTNLIKQ
jgi:hypothetical protein